MTATAQSCRQDARAAIEKVNTRRGGPGSAPEFWNRVDDVQARLVDVRTELSKGSAGHVAAVEAIQSAHTALWSLLEQPVVGATLRGDLQAALDAVECLGDALGLDLTR